MKRSTKLSTLLCSVILLLILLPQSLFTIAQTWPWSGKGEPFPWLDYLASLTPERGITLRVLTRHESSIQSLTRKLFLESPVAKTLGIVEIQFLYVAAELWPDYIEKAKKLGTPIDVAWGGGPTLFNSLDEYGYLMPLDTQIHPEHYAVLYEMSKIPERIAGAETYKSDPEGHVKWIGASVSSFGFTLNKLILSQYGVPEAKSWDDLTRPEYAKYLPAKSLIGTADPTMSTSNLRIFEIILQAKGWDKGWRTLTLLAANSIIYPGSGDVRDAVIKGDIGIGTTIDFYGYMAMNVNPNCQYIAPQGETIVNSDPIAILKDTKYPVHAAAFVAWVLSEFGGQVVWLNSEINRIPINPKTFDTPEGAKRPDLKSAFEDLLKTSAILFNETLSVNWVNSVMYYFKATLVNAHSDLQATWAQVAQAYLNGKISKEWFDYLVQELGKTVTFTDPLTGKKVEFTIEYAIQVNKKIKEDPSVYQALMTAWENAAREKYTYVLSLLNKALRGEPVPTQTTTTTPTTSPTTTPTQTPIETTTTTPITTPETTSPSPTTPQGGGVSLTLIALIVILVVTILLVVLLRRR